MFHVKQGKRDHRRISAATPVRSVLLATIALSATHAGLALAAPQEIPFSSDLAATLDLAKESGKPIVLAFAAVWCPNCRWMERVTLRAPEVLALADSFHWVLIDIDRNLTLASEYDVIATPQIYFLDSTGKPRRRIVGAVPPDEYQALLTGFLAEVEAEPEGEELVLEPEAYSRTELTWKPEGYRGLAICFSHVGYGPLHVQSQSPFQSLRLSLIPRTPSTLARNQLEVRGTATWANIWAVDKDELLPGGFGDYFLDYEMLTAGVAVAYGITDTLQVEGEFQERRRFGGAMDGFIQSFHDLFGVDQNGRDKVPKDLFTFVLDRGGGMEPISLTGADRGTFSRNLLFTIQHNVTCGTPKLPAFSYAVTGRWNLEDGSDLKGSDFDLGLSVATSRRFGTVYAYLTLGLARYGSDSFRGLELRETQLSGLGVVEWRLRPRMSLLFQWLASEGVARDFDPFSATSHELTLGWKGEIVEQGVLEVGIVENFITFDNSPDFGLHAGFTQRF